MASTGDEASGATSGAPVASDALDPADESRWKKVKTHVEVTSIAKEVVKSTAHGKSWLPWTVVGNKSADGNEADEADVPEDEAAAAKFAAMEARFQATRPSPSAYRYKLTEPALVIFRWHGTFWPLVIRRFETYVYVTVHSALIITARLLRDGEDDDRTSGDILFGSAFYMVPWQGLSLTIPLASFFLVFFIGQCYGRMMKLFDITVNMETSVHETAMLCVTHIKPADGPDEDEYASWDVVRYLTASALIVYFRASKLADFKEAMVDISEFDRMLHDEREWLQLDIAIWEKIMGWPRSREEAKNYTKELHALLGISSEQPQRLANTPPLLKHFEVDLLRQYPGGMMSLVLQTWALQRARKTGKMPGPLFNGLQASVFKLRAAAYAVRQNLAMPIPLPYFHSLNWLLNFNYTLYTVALLYHESNLTPIVLFIGIVITAGMREVAAALANPFGDDDVDFPIHKLISQLRGTALCVHPSNVPIARPARAAPSCTGEPPSANSVTMVQDRVPGAAELSVTSALQ